MTISLEEFQAVASEAERYRRERDYWKAWAKATAERQREACAVVVERTIRRSVEMHEDVDLEDSVRATPLVTEGDK